ncbi:SdpI family protein [Floccifex sp.]|uniref:SdpI family protein n=1 Tax=Floccifex sp. TaxID=2815810 RepID=UPI003F0015CB
MTDWILNTFCIVVIPIVLILCGLFMWKSCPKKINGLIGYRTTRSMMNQDTWTFANMYCGQLWWKMGWCMLIGAVIIQTITYSFNQKLFNIISPIIMALEFVVMFCSISMTEKALKEHFTEDGRRK